MLSQVELDAGWYCAEKKGVSGTSGGQNRFGLNLPYLSRERLVSAAREGRAMVPFHVMLCSSESPVCGIRAASAERTSPAIWISPPCMKSGRQGDQG
jgi:hypothetical protein